MRTNTTRRKVVARGVGRGLVAASGVALAVVPWITDMNRGHTLGPGWDGHARLHGIATVLACTGKGALVTALATREHGTAAAEQTAVRFAAAVPLIHWLPYNVSALLPTTSVDETLRTVPRVFGLIPANLLGQNFLAALAAAGLGLHHWALRR